MRSLFFFGARLISIIEQVNSLFFVCLSFLKICAVHSHFGLCVGVYLRYMCVCVKEKLCVILQLFLFYFL